MNRACLRCQAELPEASESSSFTVTQSVCPECRKQLTHTPRSIPLRNFLNHLPTPVLLVDGDVCVQDFNEAARALLGKNPPEILHHRGGEVMECAYSRLPGGCGNTEHCKACTIRRAVATTHATGISQCRVPAYADLAGTTGVRETRFLISTEKVGQFVFLSIDEVTPSP
jgi:PAS domain-containing protein